MTRKSKFPNLFRLKNVNVIVERDGVRSLRDVLDDELQKAVSNYKEACKVNSITAAKLLYIDVNAAMQNFITGSKIQQFANNTVANDSAVINEQLVPHLEDFDHYTEKITS